MPSTASSDDLVLPKDQTTCRHRGAPAATHRRRSSIMIRRPRRHANESANILAILSTEPVWRSRNLIEEISSLELWRLVDLRNPLRNGLARSRMELSKWLAHIVRVGEPAEAVIDFEFRPVKPSYPFRIRFRFHLVRNVPSQFEVFINGREIDLTGLGRGLFGVIPSSVLCDDMKSQKAPVDPQYFGLSVIVDWFEVGERPVVALFKGLPLP